MVALSIGAALRLREERDARGVALRKAVFGDANWATAQGRSMLGDVLARRGPGAREEALRELQAGYDGLRASLDSNNVRVMQARERLEVARSQDKSMR